MDSLFSRLKTGASGAKDKAKQTEEKVGGFLETGMERHKQASQEVGERFDNATQNVEEYGEGRLFPETGQSTRTSARRPRQSFMDTMSSNTDSQEGTSSFGGGWGDSQSDSSMGMSPGAFAFGPENSDSQRRSRSQEREFPDFRF